MVDKIFCPYGMIPDFVHSIKSGSYTINILNEFFSPDTVEFKECEGKVSYGSESLPCKVFISPVYLQYSKAEGVASEARTGWTPKRLMAVGSDKADPEHDLWKFGCFFTAYRVLCNIVYATRFVNQGISAPLVKGYPNEFAADFKQYMKNIKTSKRLQDHINRTLKLGAARGYYIYRDRKPRVNPKTGEPTYQQHYFLAYTGKLGAGLVYSSYPGLPTSLPEGARVVRVNDSGVMITESKEDYNIFRFLTMKGGTDPNRIEIPNVVQPPKDPEKPAASPNVPIEEPKAEETGLMRMEGWGNVRY